MFTNTHPMVTRLKSGIIKPKNVFCLQAQPTTESEPISFKEAALSTHWQKTMQEEFLALQNQGTWKLVPADSSQRVLGYKWVYKLKRDAQGNIARYKARLVANGYNQQPGVDFHETFNPVVRMATIRLIVSLSLHFGWKIHPLDVKNAFFTSNREHSYGSTSRLRRLSSSRLCVSFKKGDIWPASTS